MTPEQALALLHNVVSQIQANWPQHQEIQQAIAVLREALKPRPPEKENG